MEDESAELEKMVVWYKQIDARESLGIRSREKEQISWVEWIKVEWVMEKKTNGDVEKGIKKFWEKENEQE